MVISIKNDGLEGLLLKLSFLLLDDKEVDVDSVIIVDSEDLGDTFQEDFRNLLFFSRIRF